MSVLRKNLFLVFLVVVLTAYPLVTVHNSEFGGADGAVSQVIGEIAPGYRPWFSPLWETPGGETESLLFSLQAALGAGFLGYYIGFKRGKKAGREQ